MADSTGRSQPRERLSLQDFLHDLDNSDSESLSAGGENYPSDDLISTDDEFEPPEEISDSDSGSNDGLGTGDGPPHKRARLPQRLVNRLAANAAHILQTGWSKTFTAVDTTFQQNNTGPKNIPSHINTESEAIDFSNLFLNDEFWDCSATKQIYARTK